MQFKKFVDMDVTAVEVKLHPKAKDYLFEYYVTLKRIFSDVLGQIETDYISIALINQKAQIFFLSSKPSLEQNLIEKGLWQFDGSYQPSFIYQEQPKLWSEFPQFKDSEKLKKYKLYDHSLITGISIPAEYADYKVIFSFGFKKRNSQIENKAHNYCEKLISIGKYCLREIKETVPFPDKPTHSNKHNLKLIINNQVTDEHTSR